MEKTASDPETTPASTQGIVTIHLTEAVLTHLLAAANTSGVNLVQFCEAALIEKAKPPRAQRTNSLTAKLHDSEMERVRAAAEARETTPSELSRQLITAGLDPENLATRFELAALRELLIGVILHLTTTGRDFSLAALKELLARVDETAQKRATATLTKVSRAIAPPRQI